MLAWSVAVRFCPSLGLCRLFSVLNSGVPSLLCSPTGLAIQGLTTSMLLGQLAGCWTVAFGQTSAFSQRWRFGCSGVQYMIQARGRDTARVAKVKGHSTDENVEHGRVRLADKVGNDEADAAADLGRRHQSEMLTDDRRILLKVRNLWYPIVLQLHKFMIAVARVPVRHYGRVVLAVIHLYGIMVAGRRCAGPTFALMLILPLYLVLLVSWMGLGCRFVMVALLVLTLLLGLTVLASCSSLLLSLVPCIGRWMLVEQWAGHRLLSEKAIRPHVRANRPLSFSSVPVSEGIEIRYGCQLISRLVRALAKLPGGMGRFLPCGFGSHMSGLRHLGWNQCSHGLTSRPLESFHHLCLKAVCGGFGAWHLEAPSSVFTMRFAPMVFT